MFCRLFDECFLVLNRQEELAFHAGFTGQRAVRTWKDRVRRLRELGFIGLQSAPMGEFSYALFWNPYHVIHKHYQAGRVHEPKWHALVVRANEIGATDIEQAIKAEEQAAAAAAAEAAAAASAAAASRRGRVLDLDDEIPF